MLYGAFVVIRKLQRGAFGRYKYQEKMLKKMFLKRKKTGMNSYRPGPSGKAPDGSYRMPGPLAGTVCNDYEDAFGNRFGMIWDEARRTGSVGFSVAAPGLSMFDQQTVDQMVADWASVHHQAGLNAAIVQMAATVVATKDTGRRLPLAVQRNRQGVQDEDVPDLARSVMDEVLDIENRSIPRLEHIVTLTFSGAPVKEAGLPARSRTEVADEIATVMNSFRASLEHSSAGVCRVMLTDDLTDHFYAAYNPGQADAIDAARISGEGTGLLWEEAGPTYADEEKDYYEHSGFYTKVFQQWKPPAALFHEDSLRALLGADLGVAKKRVTILFRPQTPAASQVKAMEAIREAKFEVNQKGEKASSESKEANRRAHHTESELGQGAVLVPFSAMVAITTEDTAKFRKLAAETTGKASTGINIRIREATWTHSAAFALALGAGLVPQDFEMKGM